MDINAHFVRKITATAKHSPEGDTHWIVLTVHELSRHSKTERNSEIQLFTEGANAGLLADCYAAAINAVNAEMEAQQEASEQVEEAA